MPENIYNKTKWFWKMKIKELIKIGESETVEFKKSTGEWKEIVETISAFANKKGGVILVGVDEKKEICGVSICLLYTSDAADE